MKTKTQREQAEVDVLPDLCVATTPFSAVFTRRSQQIQLLWVHAGHTLKALKAWQL